MTTISSIHGSPRTIIEGFLQRYNKHNTVKPLHIDSIYKDTSVKWRALLVTQIIHLKHYKPYLYYVDSSVMQTINFVPFGVKHKEEKSLYYCLLM